MMRYNLLAYFREMKFLYNLLGMKATQMANSHKNVSRKNKKNNKTTVLVQRGGVAPVNYQYPARMQQPSEAVMEWATTAGAPMPPASQMRNVAHGGKRSTEKRSTKKQSKKMRTSRRNRRN
jgi:hypothetical protein